MTDNDKALDKIIRSSMPFDFERKETLSDDKTLVKRLRWSASGKVNAEQARLERNAADRIEVLNGLFTNATYEAAEMMKEIERLREALVTVRARIEDIENPFEDGTKQEHIAFEKAVDAASLIASEVLGDLHVAKTCKENGGTFT